MAYECCWCGEQPESKEEALEHECDDKPTVYL